MMRQLRRILLNPLKSDYMYEDVAREQLGLMIDEKADGRTKACYEAYTAFAAERTAGEPFKRYKELGAF